MVGRGRLDTQVEIVSSGEGIYARHLAPSTTLLVWTLNTLYRLVIRQALDVSVQGGAWFPEPTAARLVGSSRPPGGGLKMGWIGIGFRIELRSESQYVVTSPVRAIISPDPPRPDDGGRGAALVVPPNGHTLSDVRRMRCRTSMMVSAAESSTPGPCFSPIDTGGFAVIL